MRNEEAKLLLNFLLPQVLDEAATTKRVIAAVAAGNSEYRPDPVSRKAIELAWHIACTDVWVLDSILAGKFVFTGQEPPIPSELRNAEAMANWYEKTVAEKAAQVQALSTETLAQEVDFFGFLKWPLVAYLQLLIKHSVHHRGQLSAYLRAMGSKVPNIYGGSADEPMQAPATATAASS